MIIRKLSAGDITEARCTRCRDLTNHRIVAMVGEQIVRVECNTCGGVHNYRKPAEPKAAAVKRTTLKKEPVPRKARIDPGAADLEEWELLRPAMDRDRAIAYDMGGKYRVKDLMDHPVFGLGVVKGVLGGSKVEVLFQTGKKLLRCQ